MGRSPCCAKEGLNRGAWSAQEDNILREYIRIHGEGKWRNLPKRAGLKRCGKSCRLRWLNYLRPDIKRGNISPEEEELIIRLHKLLGNRWSLIAGRLPGRTDNEIKNYWNTNLGKRLQSRQSAAPTSMLPGNSDGNNGVPKVNQAPETVPSSPPRNMNPYVIRTKAVRCSKVRISPQPNKCEKLETKKGPDHPMEDGLYPTNKPVNYSTSEELLSFPTGEDNPSSDFMMNFNMGDICLSTLLNSDFPDICGFSGNEDISNDPSPSPDQPLMFSEEMLQDWTPSGCVQTNAAPNLQSFSSLLDSGGEWLVE